MSKIFKQSYYDKRDKSRLYKNRIRKKVVAAAVREILSIAESILSKPLREIRVLDVGSGNGEYSFELEKYVGMVVGVEPYKKVYDESVENAKRKGSSLEFHNSLIEHFRTKEKFDLIVSLTTIEHMPNAEKSFGNIFNLLADDGFIFLTAPNKLWPYESHYDLFFLSWLPLKLANYYVRLFNRGTSYEDSAYSKTFWGMKRLFDDLGYVYEFVVPSEDSEYIGCGKGDTIYKTMKTVGIRLISKIPLFWIFSKGFIMLIKKYEHQK